MKLKTRIKKAIEEHENSNDDKIEIKQPKKVPSYHVLTGDGRKIGNYVTEKEAKTRLKQLQDRQGKDNGAKIIAA